MNPGVGVLGQRVSGSFNFYMSLEKTKAMLATNPVAGQPAWLLGFLLSSRETCLILRLGLDRLETLGGRQSLSKRRPLSDRGDVAPELGEALVERRDKCLCWGEVSVQWEIHSP